MMNAFKTLISLALLVSTVRAGIYVTNPVQSTVCSGGQSCEIDWVDDGQSPLLSSIGECTVGLYNGEMVLVQSLSSVDVSTTQSLSFTPNPSAGPSGSYYLVFTSNSISYQAWSATFTLDGMTGSGSGNSTSAGSSTASGTSTFSASSTLPSSVSTTLTSSGTISASTPTTPVTSSGVSTLTTPSSTGTTTHTTTTTTSTSSSSSASSTQSGAALRTGASHSLAGGLILAFAGALVF